jgi:hypothetical protein
MGAAPTVPGMRDKFSNPERFFSMVSKTKECQMQSLKQNLSVQESNEIKNNLLNDIKTTKDEWSKIPDETKVQIASTWLIK